jgi:hypothetical protein
MRQKWEHKKLNNKKEWLDSEEEMQTTLQRAAEAGQPVRLAREQMRQELKRLNSEQVTQENNQMR